MLSVTKDQLSHALVVWLFFSAALSAIPVYLMVHDQRKIHWLNTDGTQATATVMAYDHPLLKYLYQVNGHEYTGRVKTSHEYDVGEKFDVFFSASHPWISSIGRPPLHFEGGGLVPICLGMSMVVLIAVIASLRNEKRAA
jgi:hypothetical protein